MRSKPVTLIPLGALVLGGLLALVFDRPLPGVPVQGKRAVIVRTAHQSKVVAPYGTLPVAFEANRGQTDPRVRYLARGRGFTLFLAPTEAVLTLRAPASQRGPRDEAHLSPVEPGSESPSFLTSKGSALLRSAVTQKQQALRMRLSGANPSPRIAGLDELPGKVNYFRGNNPRLWHANIPTYAKVRYRAIYPGVDLVYYGNQRQLEYDFVVAPGADPRAILIGFEGAERAAIDGQGNLALGAAGETIQFRKPVAYQQEGSARKEIAVSYIFSGEREVTFRVGEYDRAAPLIIDPVLEYSTYLGGSSEDDGRAIAVDATGSAYITGFTSSVDFPSTPGAFQTGFSNVSEAFVTKLAPDGTSLVYSTYLGGSGQDEGFGVAVDSSGGALVSGFTASADFPTTPGAFQTALGTTNGNAFLTKLAPSGASLVFSTYLGGSGSLGDFGNSLAIDSTGNAYIAGSTNSSDFPTTVGAFQATPAGGIEAFVTKLASDGKSLVYSTYLGGTGSDGAFSITVDSAGGAYVTGITDSANFPTTIGAFDTTLAGSRDAYVTKLAPDGSSLLYSTYLGGSDFDLGGGIAVDSAGSAYVTGDTASSDFPTLNSIQNTFGGLPSDAFVSKLDPAGSALVYSTYLGGGARDEGFAIAVNATGNAFVTGRADSGPAFGEFPIFNAFQSSCGACQNAGPDAFVAELNPAGSGFVYSSFYGASGVETGIGLAIDATDNAYVTGTTESNRLSGIEDLYVTPGAVQTSFGGGRDVFVIKVAPADLPGFAVSPAQLTFADQLVATTSAPQSFALYNAGSADLSITDISITGPDGADFSLTNTCGGSLVAGGTNCSISVTFTPTAAGTRNAAGTITDNAAGSPHSVPLTGTGVTGAPAVSLSPTSLTFAGQLVTTSSAAQNITLTNSGTATLNIASITITGANSSDFTQTNTCGATVAASANCSISVTFKATATGNRAANVTITDDAANSPQNAGLTGIGTDFTIEAAAGGSTSATVAAGQTATYNLQVTPVSGFNGTVALSCSGAPLKSTCSVSPASVTPNGIAASPFTITDSTTAPTMIGPWRIPTKNPPLNVVRLILPLLLLLALLTFLSKLGHPSGRPKYALVPALALVLFALTWAGACGEAGQHNPGTPPGSYTLTVKGDSGGVSHSVSLTLTVK